jgi:hypothetical protein
VFRRRKRGSHSADPQADLEPAEAEPEVAEGKTPRPSGPFDGSEVDLDEARRTHIDLGGMLVPAMQGMQVQLQLDNRSGKGTSALLRVEKAAVQLIAIAAPRTSGMWEQTRLQVSEDAKRRGGTADEGTGPFGVEIRAVVPMTTPEGKKGRQPSRVSGIDGPRWMLRATFLGAATTDAAMLQRMVEVVRGVVVLRGDSPMPPGDVIPLTPPDDGSVTSQTPEG